MGQIKFRIDGVRFVWCMKPDQRPIHVSSQISIYTALQVGARTDQAGAFFWRPRLITGFTSGAVSGSARGLRPRPMLLASSRRFAA